MKSEFFRVKLRFLLLSIASLLLISACGRLALAKTAPDERAQHHSVPGATPMTPAGNQAAPAGTGGMVGGRPEVASGGGMGAGAEEMMRQMSAPPRKEIYPSLMALPDEVTPEARAKIEQLAHERMNAGAALLSSGLEKLSDATSSEDYAAMQQATAQMHEGLAEFEAGLAARRVLSEGAAPRNLALDWFKREMNLASPVRPDAPRALFGIKPFHFFTIVLLVAFALAMIAMYFFKLRRAATLFGRIQPDSGAPPPGAAPPLAGAPGPPAPGAPPAPSGGKTSPPGGSSAARVTGGDTATPAPSATPSAVSEATSEPPVAKNWRGRLRVVTMITETPSVKTIRLMPSSSGGLMPFTFAPGQFLNVSFWIGGARMNRSYSISSSPTQREYVDLTVHRAPRGAVSRHINDLLKVGSQIEAAGPVGKFTFTGAEADSIVLIAGGVGITPMMSIMRYLTERAWAGDIFCVYSFRTPADFVFANEVATLQRLNPKLHVAVTIERTERTDWQGPRGHITKELLTQTVPELASRRIHLCGPPPMMDAIKAILAELGVPPGQVKTEDFGTAMPAPATAGTTAKPTAPATGPLVTFLKSNKSARIRDGQTVLELSEELAIPIQFSCRVGSCGVCKVKMTSGAVEMAVEDALEPDDKANGIILACQAKPKGAVTVEA